jgi:exonuclease SbcC
MKLLHLTVQAFGPFAGRETVDFTALGEHPLFLINGPTGAGKTTLLDGICFALYGKLTGDEREPRKMRCQQAPEDCLTEVELLFALGERRYRIRRIPEQERAKQRGEGTTVVSHSAELYACDSAQSENGETLLAGRRLQEVNAQIEALTGLDVKQFRQVMVLPQGQFRDLLLAPSSEREAIFSQLFQTQLYKHLERELVDRAGTLRKERSELLQRITGALQTLDVESAAALNTSLLSAQEDANTLGEQFANAAQKTEVARRAYTDAQQLAALQQELDEANRALQQLDEQKEIIASQSARYAAAQAAQKMTAHFERWQAAAEELSTAQTLLSQTGEDLVAAEQQQREASGAFADARELEPELETLRAEQHRLEGLRQDCQQWEQAQREHEDAQRALKKTEAAFLALEQKRGGLLQSLQSDQQQLAAIETALVSLDNVEGDLARAETVRNDVRALQQALADRSRHLHAIEVAQEQVNKARADWQADQRVLQDAQAVWRAGQAALLAEHLAPGDQCPVCGSTEHPARARSMSPIPEETLFETLNARIDLRQRHLQEAENQLTSAQTRLATLDEQLATQRAKLGEYADATLESVEAVYTEQLAQRTQRDKLRQERSVLQARQAVTQQQVNDNDIAIAQQRTYLQADQERVTAQASRVALLEQAVAPELRGPNALESRIAACTTRIEALLKQLLDAQEQVNNANVRVSSVQSQYQERLARQKGCAERAATLAEAWQLVLRSSVFASEDAFLAAHIDEEITAALAAEIKAYEERVLLLQQRRDDLARKTEGHSPPNLDLLSDQLKAARRAEEEAQQALSALQSQMQYWREAEQKIARLQQDIEVLEQRYQLVGTLADVASGNNASNMTLQRFVLSVLLDDVLSNASLRLSRMTRGRYMLLRREGVSDGRRAAGLELDVEDSYSGKTREVATLSGGESFMAALALALGLSDVVQNYAGGIRLDTLFIDEGFGTLDPDALDEAIKTLIDLRNQGRTIGVISHVPELKQQITQQIRIDSTRGGSRIRVLPG